MVGKYDVIQSQKRKNREIPSGILKTEKKQIQKKKEKRARELAAFITSNRQTRGVRLCNQTIEVPQKQTEEKKVKFRIKLHSNLTWAPLSLSLPHADFDYLGTFGAKVRQ